MTALSPQYLESKLLSGLTVALVMVPRAEHAKRIRADARVNPQDARVYELEGALFFASAARFNQLFAPKDDPHDVVLDFARARVVDHSAIQAIDALALRYRIADDKLA